MKKYTKVGRFREASNGVRTNVKKSLIALLLLSSLSSQAFLPILAFADEATSTPDTTAIASDSSSTTTESISSDSSQSDSSTLDTSDAQNSSSEQHDDLSIHVTTSSDISTPSIPTSSSTITEAISDTASTTQSGFLGDLDFTLADATTSPEATSEDMATTTSTSGSSDSDPTSCAALTDAQESLTSTTTTNDTNPTIRSGTATVYANILNLLNTTFINSPGGILFSNFTETAPTIDLRDASLLTSCQDSSCSGQDGLEVHVVGDAAIDNQLLLDANSGQNAITHPDGHGATTSIIETGDAFAGLNLVNIANTTFINSHYLIVTLNAFRGVNGDIVFPSLLNFFASGGSGAALQDGSSLTNTATVGNDVTAAADSGSNETTGSDTSVITTGSADAHTNIFNQINSLLPNSQISILFRISGTWNGQVFGLPGQGAPSGVSKIQGPDGSVYIFGAAPSGSAPNRAGTTLNSTTTTDINNHVELGALSGQNLIENASTSVITTGDALASANIVNIANQNVIGRNWILAIIDIFGDFTGNIAFGRPDLWVGDQVQAPGVVQNGSTLTYKITVLNNGDSVANHVVVMETPDFAHLNIMDMSLPTDPCIKEKLAWNLGTLLPGQAVEITYTAQVKNTAQGDRITNTTNAIATETDNNTEDNSDSTSVQATILGGGGGGSCCSYPTGFSNSANSSNGITMLASSTLQVVRMTADTTLDGTTTVPQRIVVQNTTDSPINNVVFHDYLRDPTSGLVHEERWMLDTVAPHEQITIQYSVVFDQNAMPGTYHLSTLLEGKNYPTTLAGNGTILIKATPQLLAMSGDIIPKIRIINRGAVQDGPILVKATSTLPAMGLTAAAAASDSNAADKFTYLVLFLLLFAASYWALRELEPTEQFVTES